MRMQQPPVFLTELYILNLVAVWAEHISCEADLMDPNVICWSVGLIECYNGFI